MLKTKTHFWPTVSPLNFVCICVWVCLNVRWHAHTYVLMLRFYVYWHRCMLQPWLWRCQIRKSGEIGGALMKGRLRTWERWRWVFYWHHMESTSGFIIHAWALYRTYSNSKNLNMSVWLQSFLLTFMENNCFTVLCTACLTCVLFCLQSLVCLMVFLFGR